MLQRWLVRVVPIASGAYTVEVAAPDYQRALDIAAHVFLCNREFGSVWEVSAEAMDPSADNVDKPMLYVYYEDLDETETTDVLRRECPVCAAGRLLLRRDEVTMEILPEDKCILCRQRVQFMDCKSIGEGPRHE